MKSTPLVLVLALLALLSLPVGASAVHWPNFGGDAGRSGDQPVDPGTVPVAATYQKTQDRVIQTSIITSAGGNATRQRMIYGTITNPSGQQFGCQVHLQVLLTGAAVGAEAGVPICSGTDAANADGFGTRAQDGSVTPVESSSGSALGQIYAIHNDVDSDVEPEPATGGVFPSPCVESTNDIAIAQIDESDASLVRDVGIGSASASSSPVSGTCGDDSRQFTEGFKAESSPVLTPPLNEAGDRALFFLARNSGGTVRLIKVGITKANTTDTTYTFQFVNVAGANHLASPSIAYLNDPSVEGAPLRPFVLVPRQTAGAGGLTAYRVGNLAAGPTIADGPTGTPQTPSSPVTSTGAVPESTPLIYLAYENGDTTVVRKFRQKADDAAVLEPVGDASPALAGKPSRALALAQEVVDGTPEAGGSVVVSTGTDLFVLDAGDLTVSARLQDPPEVPLVPGADGFAGTAPAVSGELAYITRDNGDQLIIRLSDGEPVAPADFTEHVANATATSAVGQPSLSRGFIQMASDAGAFVYRATDPDPQPPTVQFVEPAENGQVRGNAARVAAQAVDPDGISIKVEFFIDPNCEPPFPGGKLGEDSVPLTGTDEYAVLFDTTRCPDGFYTLTATATDGDGETTSTTRRVEVDNIANPTADFTVSPDQEEPSGTEFTFDATPSAPAATPADQAITKYEWDYDSDGTYDFESTTSKVFKHTYVTPGVYDVTLRVTQTNGQSDTATKQVTVTNRPPVASFAAAPNPAQAGETVFFDGTASTDPDGPITKYEWDYDGDSAFDQTTTGPKTSFVYTTPGKRTAQLRVTDASGATNTVARDIEVTGKNVPPTASFKVTPNPATTNVAVTFDATASADPDGAIAKYEWDLDGNGSLETNSGANPRTQRVYPVPAVYNVKLRVTDNTGAAAETVRQVTVSGASTTVVRKAPVKLTAAAKPKRDRTLPYVFKTSGRLTLPRGVARIDGCTGRVKVTVKVGKKTVSTRTTALRTGCGYSSRVTFRNRTRLGTAKRVRISVRFGGNKVLKPKSARTFSARIG